jgi:hypothetical protein
MSPDGYNAMVRMYPFLETVSAQGFTRSKTAAAFQDFRFVESCICFTLTRPDQATIRVFDLKGGLVADLTANVRRLHAGPVRLPLSLRGGMYMCAFDNGKTSGTRNIAVIR